MTRRGTQVNDPHSVVLIDNISNSVVCLPREGVSDILFKPRETVQITWAEFVKFKSMPHFGKLIKLNDSVVISDGQVLISNTGTSLTDDDMISVLVQDRNRIKEFVLTLNKGEITIFENFLNARVNIGIEQEKCTDILDFIVSTDKVKKAAAKKAKAAEKRKANKEAKEDPNKTGDNKTDEPNFVVTESKDSLAAHVTRTGNSE